MSNHNRKSKALKPYVAMVEGEQDGVPFRTFYKQMPTAENDCLSVGGKITDLRTLKRRVAIKVYDKGVYSHTDWREA